MHILFSGFGVLRSSSEEHIARSDRCEIVKDHLEVRKHVFRNIKILAQVILVKNSLNHLRVKKSGEEELLCYNRGCGQRYVESKNTEGEELISVTSRQF